MLALPRGTTVKIVTTHGASFWVVAKRIEVALPDGSDKSYFLKVWRHIALLCCNIILTCFMQIYSSDLGKRMAEAEFEGTAAIHAVLPKNAAGTIAWVMRSQTSCICDTKLFIDRAHTIPTLTTSMIKCLTHPSLFRLSRNSIKNPYPLLGNLVSMWECMVAASPSTPRGPTRGKNSSQGHSRIP